MNHAVVIGASRGLGLSLTIKLLESGYKVAAGVRTKTDDILSLIPKYKDKLLVFPADVTNESQMQKGALLCHEFLGNIKAVCNSAGVLLAQDRIKLLHECDIDELRKSFDVNTIGIVITVKSFYPYLADNANFFSVTSEGVAISNCGTWVPCYGLSKTAATKISGILNESVRNANFYSVHPGRMNTEMGKTTAQIEPEQSADGLYKLINGETPISRNSWYIDYQGNNMPC